MLDWMHSLNLIVTTCYFFIKFDILLFRVNYYIRQANDPTPENVFCASVQLCTQLIKDGSCASAIKGPSIILQESCSYLPFEFSIFFFLIWSLFLWNDLVLLLLPNLLFTSIFYLSIVILILLSRFNILLIDQVILTIIFFILSIFTIIIFQVC